MRIHKGIVLAVVGIAVLAASLVMSTPFAGHGEPRGPRSRGTRPAIPARPDEHSTVPAAEPFDPDFEKTVVTTVQETGPILFKEGELEAYLTFPVPVGKRMIIDTVSARASVGSGQKVLATMTATAGGGTASFALPMTPQGHFARFGDTFAAVQRVRAYADGGTVVTFRVERSAAGDLDSGFVSISGVLESR